MSDIKSLLEKMDAMTAAERKPTGPKWPGYWGGKESAKKSRSRMVGSNEGKETPGPQSAATDKDTKTKKSSDRSNLGVTTDSPPKYPSKTDIPKRELPKNSSAVIGEESNNLLKELDQVINENPVRRDLFQEWHEFKEGFDSTLKSVADKVVSAGSATRDALAGVMDSIPRPFDEKSYQDRVIQKPEAKADWRKTDKDKKVQEQLSEGEPETVDVIMRQPTGTTNYDDVEFYHRYKDGREERVPHGSYYHDKWYKDFTGKETPMVQQLIKGMQAPVKRGPEFVPQDPDTVQDVIVPGQDKGRYRAPLPNWRETDPVISEYGAPGSGIGNDTATNPAEVFAKGQERKNAKQQARDQIAGLVAQITGLRSQLADLNKQFPQGANPVEKAMSLQQMQAQRNGIKSQIVGLARQIAELRQQAV